MLSIKQVDLSITNCDLTNNEVDFRSITFELSIKQVDLSITECDLTNNEVELRNISFELSNNELEWNTFYPDALHPYFAKVDVQ
jgi:hypothetical protein